MMARSRQRFAQQEGLELLKQAKGIEVEYKPGLNEDELSKALSGVEGLGHPQRLQG